MPDNISDNVGTSTKTTSVSRLALLASFVAGAFAAWIIINVADEEPAPQQSMAPSSISVSR